VIAWTKASRPRTEWPAVALSVLNDAERERVAELRLAKRQNDWLLGRLVTKELVQVWLRETFGAQVACADISIRTAPGGAPLLRVKGRRALGLPLCAVSLSHSQEHVLAAVTAEPGQRIGVDLEHIEPRSQAFVDDYFTLYEKQRVAWTPAPERDVVINAIWSAKEAVLKVLGIGLTVDTRALSCKLYGDGRGWCFLRAELSPVLWHHGVRSIGGWWQRQQDFVLTAAASGGDEQAWTHDHGLLQALSTRAPV
jgi:4'-phosphopantetheinyl transferase